uniref:Uncharacterized protein n=1 Tax=Anopheles atroparvus TaxID=41427 RepID=A0A182IQK7_ANOAO
MDEISGYEKEDERSNGFRTLPQKKANSFFGTLELSPWAKDRSERLRYADTLDIPLVQRSGGGGTKAHRFLAMLQHSLQCRWLKEKSKLNHSNMHSELSGKLIECYEISPLGAIQR